MQYCVSMIGSCGGHAAILYAGAYINSRAGRYTTIRVAAHSFTYFLATTMRHSIYLHIFITLLRLCCIVSAYIAVAAYSFSAIAAYISAAALYVSVAALCVCVSTFAGSVAIVARARDERNKATGVCVSASTARSRPAATPCAAASTSD